MTSVDVDSFAAVDAAGFDDGAGNSYYLPDSGANVLFLVGVEKGVLSAVDFVV